MYIEIKQFNNDNKADNTTTNEKNQFFLSIFTFVYNVVKTKAT